jgi:16S rRNA (uracil1498-N3)-methyltransferase
MKPRRFYLAGEPLGPGERLINGKTAHHLSRVLRLRAGDPVVLFDGSGREFPAEILEVGRRTVRLQVAAGTQVDRESPLGLSLALGVCQPSTMDLVIQKVTELGVSEVVPVLSERAQRWPGRDRAASRHRRWERISQEAARQSGRSRVPQILPAAGFAEVVRRADDSALRIVFWEEEGSGLLKQALATKARGGRVRVLIGPEGGFSPGEVEEATRAGFQSVSLGRRILRAETAAIAVISVLQYELGDLGDLP